MLWAHLNHLDPDVLLIPGYYTLPALAAALWARVHQRNSILMTESTADDHQRVAWREAAKSLLIRTLFHSAVTGGRAHERYLRQLGFPADRIGHFYDVVDNQTIADQVSLLRRQPPADLNLPSSYFLYVGRLAPEKNVRALVEAWLAYRASGGSWSLVLVGDGPEAPSLRALAQASPFAQDLHFAGHKGSRDLAPFYAFAGCFVLPSSREPWGLVVNEAMAAGLPVLVSNRCGCAEDLVQPGVNGLTFDPAIEGQLLSCLQQISSAPAEALRSMRRASATRIAQYSPSNFGHEVATLAAYGTSLPKISFTAGNQLPGLR
ncbi:MAG: glycosyltransferase family 4 protein [Acidobacteriaceae bacterium]